jgi:predicted RND superfamily exporter protein
MKKLSEMIVRFRYVLLGIFLVLTVICAFLSSQVKLNDDMTRYLAAGSQTREGTDLMNEEFQSEDNKTSDLDVMVVGLDEQEKTQLADEFRKIPDVTEVEHDDTADYNTDDAALYILSVDDSSDSEAAKNVYETVNTRLADYETDYGGTIADQVIPLIPTWVIVMIIVLVLIILMLFCASYVEPFLFLATILVAVVINAGTNVIFDSVSTITQAISAVLQLALSMDYSIMLMERYRQEKAVEPDSRKAMAAALQKAMQSIAGSSLTTIGGLLMLVFMSFTIGRDMGFVLAKGIVLSLLSIFFVLPALILMFDKLIARTQKKAVKVPTAGLSSFVFRLKKPICILFVILLAGSALLQGGINTTYLGMDVSNVYSTFPMDNTFAIVYKNEDREKLLPLYNELNQDTKITSTAGYDNTIGDELTWEKMQERMHDLNENTSIKDYLIKILYYKKFGQPNANRLTMPQLLNFIEENVYNNEDFKDEVPADLKKDVSRLKKFISRENLDHSYSINELSDLLEIDQSDVKKIMALYQSEHTQSTMTLKDFVNYVLNSVLENPDYKDEFDADTISNLRRLSEFMNQKTNQTAIDAASMASLMGMDSSTAEAVYAYYLIQNHPDQTMTLKEFANYVLNDLANDPVYGQKVDQDTIRNLKELKKYVDAGRLTSGMTSEELASYLGLNASDTNQIYLYYLMTAGCDQKMTLSGFVNYVLDDLADDPVYSGSIDEETKASLEQVRSLLNYSSELQTAMTAKDMASFLNGIGMSTDESQIKQLYMYALMQNGSGKAMTVTDFLNAVNEVTEDPDLSSEIDEETRNRLSSLQTSLLLAGILQENETPLTAEAMTETLSSSGIAVDPAEMQMLYAYAMMQQENTGTMTLHDFSDEVLKLAKDKTLGSLIDSDTLSALTKVSALTDPETLNRAMDAESLAAFFDLDQNMVHQIPALSSSQMTPLQFAEFVLSSADLQAMMDETSETELKNAYALMSSAANGDTYSSTEMVSALNLDETQAAAVQSVYALKEYQDGIGTDDEFALSPKELIRVIADHGQDELIQNALDDDTKTLIADLKQLIQIADAKTAGTALQADQMAKLLGSDASSIGAFYAAAQYQSQESRMSPLQLLNFLGSHSDDETIKESISQDTLSQINSLLPLLQTAVSNDAYSASEMADLLGSDEGTLQSVYALYAQNHNGLSLSPLEFVNFVLQHAQDDAMKDSMTESDLSKLQQASNVMNAVVNGSGMSYTDLASLLQTDEETVKDVYALYQSRHGGLLLSPQEFAGFLLTHAQDTGIREQITSDDLSELNILSNVMGAVNENRSLTVDETASLLGLTDTESLRLVYGLHDVENGANTMMLGTFVDFLHSDVMGSEKYGSSISEDDGIRLNAISRIKNDALNGKAYTRDEMLSVLNPLSSEIKDNTMQVLYMYYGSVNRYDPSWKMSVEEFVDYLNNDVLKDQALNEYLSDDDRKSIQDSQDTVEDARKMLVGKEYSRISLTTRYDFEGDETNSFVKNLRARLQELAPDAYLIGDSTMSYEMSQTFTDESNRITLLTMVVIFLIVAATFRSLAIPAILIFVIQCAVYLAMAAAGMISSSVYFLAILIVQSILMGATIDYAIVYSSYYLEERRTSGIRDAMKNSYAKAIGTIMTSASILIICTLMVGMFANGIVGSICKSICIGTIFSTLLILFVVPAMTAVFDRFVVRKKK